MNTIVGIELWFHWQLHCHLETTGDYINVSREKCPYCAWHNPNTTATIDLDLPRL